jgi:hypothetical protein
MLRALRPKVLRWADDRLRPLGVRIVRDGEMWRPLAELGRQPAAGPAPDGLVVPLLRAFHGSDVTSGAQFDCSVVIPTVLRPTLLSAIESIYSQRFNGRIQVLIGIDAMLGSIEPLLAFLDHVPPNVSVVVFYPGYSTSRRHGSLHPTFDGGALRTLLSYMAHSRRVAYLDDDNWCAPEHLATLATALDGNDWAYSGRIFVHPVTRRPICVDEWESVGPGKGEFSHLGGWVDPNCLMLDKLACEPVLRWWSIPLRNSTKAMDADRNVFRILSTEFHGHATGRATSFYTLSEGDERHPFRMSAIGERRYSAAGESEIPDC